MKKQIKQQTIRALEKAMDYVIGSGWTFRSLSKGLIFSLAIYLTTVSVVQGTTVEKGNGHRGGIVYAEEVEVGDVVEEKEAIVEGAEEATKDKQEEEVKKEVTVEDTLNQLWGSTYTEDEKGFLHKVAPVALEVAKEYQVYPSIIVAQSILESDWGKSELAVNANNYFGVKGSFNGQSYTKATMEDDGTGVQTQIIADFAKYPTIKESITSNAELVRTGTSFDSGYYKGAWVENTTSYKDATLALTGSYATDIYYNKKVNKIIEEYKLAELDAVVYN